MVDPHSGCCVCSHGKSSVLPAVRLLGHFCLYHLADVKRKSYLKHNRVRLTVLLACCRSAQAGGSRPREQAASAQGKQGTNTARSTLEHEAQDSPQPPSSRLSSLLADLQRQQDGQVCDVPALGTLRQQKEVWHFLPRQHPCGRSAV